MPWVAMLLRVKKYEEFLVKNLLFISFGAFLQGLAMTLFLFPHDIPSGGAAGIAILMNYFLAVPYGVALWIFNLLLLVIAFKWLGRAKTIATLYAVTVTSITISLLEYRIFYEVFQTNPFFDLLIGAVTFGIGVGLLFRSGSSSGGMAIVALLIEKYRGKQPGKSLFIINSTIFLIISLVRDWKIIILAIICQWISTKVIDFVYLSRSKETVKQLTS